MKRTTSKLEGIGEKVRSRFTAMDGAREKGLRLARESIRNSANAIRATHRGEYKEARELIMADQALIEEMGRILERYSELKMGGFVHDAQKEYAEAQITLALITGQPMPDIEHLNVSYAAYLNGLGEAAGELRRHLLDRLRDGEVTRCEELLEDMDDIYSLLVTIDFPDAITMGLRRTTDVVRGILEKTRGDLTLSMRQQQVEQKLKSLENELKGKAAGTGVEARVDGFNVVLMAENLVLWEKASKKISTFLVERTVDGKKEPELKTRSREKAMKAFLDLLQKPAELKKATRRRKLG